MRIATSQLFSAPSLRMSALTAEADKLQTRISTGKNLTAASDDPAAWRRLAALGRADANGKADSANVKIAQGLVAQTDTALESIETQLQRAQEIVTASQNGTLSAENRAAYAAELSAIMDEIMTLANSKDVRGQPVFGGADGATPFVKASNGTISYVGEGQQPAIPIGDGTSVTSGVTGDAAFGDMFASIAAIVTALNAGEAPSTEDAAGLDSAIDQVNTARASVGARAIRLDLALTRYEDTAIDREEERQGIDSVDMSAAITELQKTLTILQATQASFTKLSSLSLFDYLR